MPQKKEESTKEENSYISSDIYILGGMGGIKSDDTRNRTKAISQDRTYGNQASQDGAFPSFTFHSKAQAKGSLECRKNFTLTAGQVLESIPIDLMLQTSKFLSSWGEWIDYRLEVGRQHRWATTVHCFQKHLNKCVQWGPDRAIEAIDHSIEMGYRGLFEPRKFDNHSSLDSLGRSGIKRIRL